MLRLTCMSDESFSTNSSQNSYLQGQQSVGRALRRMLCEISLDHVHVMEREEVDERTEA